MLECKTAQASKIKTEKLLKLKLFIRDQARSYIGTRGQLPPDGCFAPLPPNIPLVIFRLHINFPSTVLLDT